MTSKEEKIVKLATKILLNGYIKSLTLRELHTPVIVALFELKSLITDDEYLAILKEVGEVNTFLPVEGKHA